MKKLVLFFAILLYISVSASSTFAQCGAQPCPTTTQVGGAPQQPPMVFEGFPSPLVAGKTYTGTGYLLYYPHSRWSLDLVVYIGQTGYSMNVPIKPVNNAAIVNWQGYFLSQPYEEFRDGEGNLRYIKYVTPKPIRIQMTVGQSGERFVEALL